MSSIPSIQVHLNIDVVRNHFRQVNFPKKVDIKGRRKYQNWSIIEASIA